MRHAIGSTYGLSSKDEGTFSESEDGGDPSGLDIFAINGGRGHKNRLASYGSSNRQVGGGIEASVTVLD